MRFVDLGVSWTAVAYSLRDDSFSIRSCLTAAFKPASGRTGIEVDMVSVSAQCVVKIQSGFGGEVARLDESPPAKSSGQAFHSLGISGLHLKVTATQLLNSISWKDDTLSTRQQSFFLSLRLGRGSMAHVCRSCALRAQRSALAATRDVQKRAFSQSDVHQRSGEFTTITAATDDTDTSVQARCQSSTRPNRQN